MFFEHDFPDFNWLGDLFKGFIFFFGFKPFILRGCVFSLLHRQFNHIHHLLKLVKRLMACHLQRQLLPPLALLPNEAATKEAGAGRKSNENSEGLYKKIKTISSGVGGNAICHWFLFIWGGGVGSVQWYIVDLCFHGKRSNAVCGHLSASTSGPSSRAACNSFDPLDDWVSTYTNLPYKKNNPIVPWIIWV